MRMWPVLIPFFLSMALLAKAQDNYTGKNLTVSNCLELAEKYKNEGDLKEATRYLNTAAMQVWEIKKYDDAITYFNQSISLNEQLNNVSGIAKINSNLGMIYADLADYKKSLEYFQRALDYRLGYGEKTEIISTHINLAVVLNNLKEYDKAVKNLEEALRLATEMNDAAQMKSCYGMLAETYEKVGNQERTMHYFDLYRTFHEMIQRNQVIAAQKETEAERTKALKLELEKANNELKLLQANRDLQFSEAELHKMDEQVRGLLEKQTKQQLAISLLGREYELSQLQIAETESKNTVQKIWILLIAIAFLAVIGLAIMFYRNNVFKKRVNAKLAAQNEEIGLMNENLEEQVQKRTTDLQNTLTRLEHRNRDLDQFSHMISHNLRGPVASILGLGKVINRQDASDPVNLEVFNRLVDSVQDLDSVVKDLSSILNIRDNEALPKEMVDVRKAVAQAEKMLAEEVAERGISVSLELSEEKVFGCKAYIESILYNLLSNAAKYSNASRPSVTVRAGRQNHGYMLQVQDNGIGIDPADFAKIFQPYTRLSLRGKGKGIGLYMVKAQAEAMGGSIAVDSKAGTGALFTLHLPEN